MALSLPYPNAPANGQALDASPIYANQNAIVAAIQSFDASQVQAGTLTAAAFAASINPNTILRETANTFVQSGCVWSSVSGLNGTMTAGVIYAPTPSSTTLRVSVSSIASHTFIASQDTYIDIDYNGNVTYQGVTNGAAAPALTANSVRVAKVVTNGSAISAISQSGIDSNAVPIYPKYAAGLAGLSNTIQTTANAGTAGGNNNYISLGGLKILWGVGGNQYTIAAGSGTISQTSTFPSGFFSAVAYWGCNFTSPGVDGRQTTYVSSPASTTGMTIAAANLSGTPNVTGFLTWLAIGT